MKHRSFDNHIKEQLGNLKPDVPPHIWEKIAAEKDKKKPFVFGWFTGLNTVAALLLLSVVSGTVYLATHHNSSKEQAADTIAKQTAADGKSNSKSASSSTHPEQSVTNTDADKNSIAVNPDQANGNSVFCSSANNDHATKTKNSFYIPAQSSILISGPEYSSNDLFSPADVNAETSISSGLALTGFSSQMNGFKNSFSFKPKMKVPFMLHGLSIPCPEAEKDAAGNKKYIEVYAGPDFAFRSINDYNDGNYTQNRRESTKPLFSYSAGIRYTKVWGSGLSIRTGINYSRINESFKQEKGHVTQNVYITNESGDTTGTYTVSGTQYKQTTNKFTTIDIPITAGYELGNGRLHTNINAGVMVNLISRQKGFVVDKGGNAVDISSDAASTVYQYKKNAGVSLLAAASVYYKLNDKLHLMAEPYFRYSLSSVTKTELSLKQKYHTAGVRLGVRMDL